MSPTGVPIDPQPGLGTTIDTAIPDFLGGEKLEDGIGLCLSGGGFRAMLFHLGAFRRLNELGLLKRIDRVASVSGGSIAAGALAVAWSELEFDAAGIATNFNDKVAVPILNLSTKRVDVPAILLGMLPLMNGAECAAVAYDSFLFRGKSLQDLPERPHFSFTATSLQSGVLWRFAKDYAADWRVGRWDAPRLPLATVVAASAAFPPYLSPAYIDVPDNAIVAQLGSDLNGGAFIQRLCLTDGGIYDNLSLEPIWKRYRTILVSDGGAVTPPTPRVRRSWLRLAMRTTDIALQQGINMRRRVLLGLQRSGERKIALWSVSDPVESYGVGNPMDFDLERTRRAASVPTRLTRFSAELRECIMQAGYAHSDAALRGSGIVFPAAANRQKASLPKI
jgi:NTE family protein